MSFQNIYRRILKSPKYALYAMKLNNIHLLLDKYIVFSWRSYGESVEMDNSCECMSSVTIQSINKIILISFCFNKKMLNLSELNVRCNYLCRTKCPIYFSDQVYQLPICVIFINTSHFLLKQFSYKCIPRLSNLILLN